MPIACAESGNQWVASGQMTQPAVAGLGPRLTSFRAERQRSVEADADLDLADPPDVIGADSCRHESGAGPGDHEFA